MNPADPADKEGGTNCAQLGQLAFRVRHHIKSRGHRALLPHRTTTTSSSPNPSAVPFIRLLRHFFPVAVSDRVRRPSSKSALGSSGAVASHPLLRFASSGVLGASFGFVDGVLGLWRLDMSPFQGYRGKDPCFWLRCKICSCSCGDWISFWFVLTSLCLVSWIRRWGSRRRPVAEARVRDGGR